MSVLYEDLAMVYEAMYQTFIDYEEEFDFYSSILRQHEVKSVLEIGSGTGNLATSFCNHGFNYLGVDASKEMIAIAQKKATAASFLQGDMRSLSLDHLVESIIIPSRTISYLVKNSDVNAAFTSFFKALERGGILCFDFIDATTFIPAMGSRKEITHKAVYENTIYSRESIWEPYVQKSWCFKWVSSFYKGAKEAVKIGHDESIVRTFTQDEIKLFLTLNGFNVLQCLERDSYAFPTYVIVAQKPA